MEIRVVTSCIVWIYATCLLAQWSPSGSLAAIPVRENCAMTGGDIAVARPGPIIWYCQAAATSINARWPGAGHFYYVHEFGHFVVGSDEAKADCWAADQLRRVPNGQYYLKAAVQHFIDRRNEPINPSYGSMLSRANRVAACGKVGQAESPQQPPTP
jgi:hypothetical protein